jgi:hypothetical protein
MHPAASIFYLHGFAWTLTTYIGGSMPKTGFTTIELTLVLAILGGLVIYTLEMHDLVAADIEDSHFVEYQQHHQEALKKIRGY